MASNHSKTTGTKTMFHVTIHVKPENVEEFLVALRSTYEDVTSEKECLFVDLYQSPDNRGLFRITEAWAADLAWFLNVQLKKPYYEPYEAATKHLWVEPRKIEFWESVPGWQLQKPGFLD